MGTEDGGAPDSAFNGFPPELFSFLEGLEKDNSKTYWEANRTTWENAVQDPIGRLMSDLEPEFGPLRTFRPNRDVRFSKDKSPYKTWVGVTTSDRAVGGIGAFLRLEASGMRLACGAMALAPDQIKRFRAAIDDPAAGAEFAEIGRALAGRSLPVGPGRQPPLKRVPTGFAKDHPRAEQLTWKGAVVVREYERADWMHRREVLDEVRGVWNGAAPLREWIERNVGGSEQPPRRPGRR
ncbi:DUF2461 domain-containing protein [Nocardiopsis baichengensis]|uniref:DUF2461 domain-containing protein n=1 Tax=Nocardiopsis baichengensis TaxID=280240 RepID=UPI00034AB5D1|nr:DUF2461 domain-containing protein [Nocardiopsis baichengensis]